MRLHNIKEGTIEHAHHVRSSTPLLAIRPLGRDILFDVENGRNAVGVGVDSNDDDDGAEDNMPPPLDADVMLIEVNRRTGALRYLYPRFNVRLASTVALMALACFPACRQQRLAEVAAVEALIIMEFPTRQER